MRKEPTIDRLFRKIELTEAGCWQWTAYLDRYGYGRICHEGTMQLAHRVAYLLLVAPIPAGLEIDHLCRNRACVNPEHLEPVTRRQNVLRGETIAAARFEQIQCVNGHLFDEVNTYWWNRNGHAVRSCRACNRLAQTKARLR